MFAFVQEIWMVGKKGYVRFMVHTKIEHRWHSRDEKGIHLETDGYT